MQGAGKAAPTTCLRHVGSIMPTVGSGWVELAWGGQNWAGGSVHGKLISTGRRARFVVSPTYLSWRHMYHSSADIIIKKPNLGYTFRIFVFLEPFYSKHIDLKVVGYQGWKKS